MTGLAAAARQALSRTPTRALPFSLLLQELEGEGIHSTGREEWILHRLIETPELFLVITARLGPWARAASEAEPWVLLHEKLQPGFGPAQRALHRIQDGLQAWAHVLDRGSQAAVARWIRGNRDVAPTAQALMGGAGREPATAP